MLPTRGLRLAELQLKIVWEEILKRFDTIEVVGPPKRVYSSFVKGYETLPGADSRVIDPPEMNRGCYVLQETLCGLGRYGLQCTYVQYGVP